MDKYQVSGSTYQSIIAKIKAYLSNSLVLNTCLIVLMRMLGAGLGFLFWALAAHSMSASSMGLASGTLSATALLAGFAQLGLGYGIVRYLAHADKPNGLLNLSIVGTGLAGIGLASLLLIQLDNWSPALLPLRANFFTSAMFVVLVLGTTLSQLLYWIFLATRQLTFSLLKQVIHAVAAIIFLFVFRILTSSYLSAVLAHFVAVILSISISFWLFLPKAQPGYRFGFTFGIPLRSSFTRYSSVNYVTDQFARAPESLLPLIVINQLGLDAGAYFYVVWMIGRVVASWPCAIAESLFSEGSNDPANAAAYTWRSVKMGLLLAGSLTFALVVSGRLILSIYGPDYVEQGATLLYCMAFALVPGALLTVLVSFLRIKDRLKSVVTITLGGNSFGIILSWIGMIRAGLFGAGVGWLAAQVIILVGVSGWWWRQSQSEA